MPKAFFLLMAATPAYVDLDLVFADESIASVLWALHTLSAVAPSLVLTVSLCEGPPEARRTRRIIQAHDGRWRVGDGVTLARRS